MEEIIDRKDKRAYAEAVRVIDQTFRPLFTEAGRSGDFPRYVDEVRAAHKPKRNLMKLIDRLDAPDSHLTVEPSRTGPCSNRLAN